MAKLYWFLNDDTTGESVAVGSLSECVAARNKLAAEWKRRGAVVTYENRRRKMIVDHEWVADGGIVKTGRWTWTIGSVDHPMTTFAGVRDWA